MAEKKIINTDRLMRPIAHFSHGSRTGDLVHIGAVAGVYTDLRLAGDTVGRLDVRAQVRRMFENLATSLDLLGAKLTDVVRVKTYIAFPREISRYLEAFEATFAQICPAHTIVGSWDFPLPQAALELDAVAMVGGTRDVLHADGDRTKQPGSAVLCGDILHASALPVDAAGGDELLHTTDQVRAAHANLATLLSRAGFKPADVCNLHVTLADMRDLPIAEQALREFFGDSIPAATFVGAPLENARDRITLEAVAIRGGGRAIASAQVPAMRGRPAPAILAGDLLFLSGQSDSVAHADVEQQTKIAWVRLNSMIAAAGLQPDAMIRTNNILTDWRDYVSFNAGYGANVREPYVPRATVLGQLAQAGARVQVEGIAHRHGAGATILQVPPPKQQ